MRKFPLTKNAVALFLALALQTAGPADAATFPDARGRVADYDWLIDQIATRYAYLPERHLDLAKLRVLYRHDAETASTRPAFIHVIEETIAELHDHHATLGTNTPSSPQLIPTGTDLWATVVGGQAVIEEVRSDSPAALAGVRAGDVVTSIGGIPALQAVALAMPKSLSAPDPEADNFALRTLLAGKHDAHRLFTVRHALGTQAIDLPPYEPPPNSAPVTRRWIKPGIGYIRIENSLGDSGTVAALDTALTFLAPARAIVLDLRNTPSGGDTDVAEPMLGRFIASKAAYQRVFDPGPGKLFPKDSWLKSVVPRAPLVNARLVVLSDHWTGSMGEGMTIGLDALHRASTVGTAMAGLSGGTGEFALPNSGITVHLPVERLYHVDGTPREHWKPRIAVDPAGAGDPILARGLKVAEQ